MGPEKLDALPLQEYLPTYLSRIECHLSGETMQLILTIDSLSGGEKPLVSTKNTSKTACVLGHEIQKNGPRKTGCFAFARISTYVSLTNRMSLKRRNHAANLNHRLSVSI